MPLIFVCYMLVTALEPEVLRDAVGVGESWVVWYGHKKKSSAETLRLLVLNTPMCFDDMTCMGLQENLWEQTPLPRRRGASLKPSPRADMDGEGTPLSVGGGCEQRSRRGQSWIVRVCGPHGAALVRAGPCWPPPNIIETGRRGQALLFMLQDDA